MTITQATVLKYGRYVALILVVATAYVIFAAITDVRNETIREEQTDINYRDTVDGVDWYTYTNEYYGYAVSFPDDVTIERPSDAYTENTDASPIANDAIVILQNSELIGTISLGVIAGNYAEDHAMLKNFVQKEIVQIYVDETDLSSNQYELIDLKNGTLDAFDLQLSRPEGVVYFGRGSEDQIYVASVIDNNSEKASTTMKVLESFTTFGDQVIRSE